MKIVNNSLFIESFTKKVDDIENTLCIFYDNDTESPRQWSVSTRMIFFNRRYTLGDKHPFNHNNYSGWDEMKADIIRKYKPAYIASVYMIDHSGLAFSLVPYGGCYGHFDSGQIGFIVIRKREANNLKKYNIDLEKAAKDELATYQQYVSGSIYRFELYKKDDLIDSCGNFYDYQSMTDYLPKAFTKVLS